MKIDLTEKAKLQLPTTIAGQAKLFGFCVFIVFLIGVVFGSSYSIDEGDRGVLLRFGKAIDVKQPGLNFKTPFIDSIVPISVRTSTVQLSDVGAYSRDIQVANFRISVTWNISEADILNVYENYKGREALEKNVIEPRVLDAVKNVFGKYTAENSVSKREALGLEMKQTLIKSFEGSPVSLVGFQIEELSFSNTFEQSIENRMQAEISIKTAEQNAILEKVKAEIAVTQAKAQADAILAQAEADAKAIELRGVAEAKAIELRANALSKNANIVQLNAVEKWDGKLPSSMPPNSTVPFVNITK